MCRPPSRRRLPAAFQREPTTESESSLPRSDTASVTDLARPFDMSMPAVMQHLAVLEASGLVRSQKRGRVRTCRIDPQGLGQVEDWINARRREWERRLDRLGQYLDALKNEGESNA